MKLLLPALSLLLALNVSAIEAEKKVTDVARPQSNFEKTGRDPFAPAKPRAVPKPDAEKLTYRLSLNGITRENGQRRALVSGVLLQAGESAFVKTGETGIKIICEEIRDNSVLLRISDNVTPVELSFGQLLKVDAKGIPVPAK